MVGSIFQAQLPVFFVKDMSKTRRDVLAVGLILLLTLLSFGAGFLFNDVIFSPGESLIGEDSSDFGIYWDAWDFIEQNFIGDFPEPTKLTYGAVRGSINELGDPYTIFIEPEVREEEKERFRGNFGGIGARLQRNDEGDLILTPIRGNPAEAAGILEGDILIAVDGKVIHETYVKYECDWNMSEILVGESEYFVVGDNRSGSIDTHEKGRVDRTKIMGRPLW